MASPRRRARLFINVPLVATLLLVGACSGDDDTETAGSDTVAPDDSQPSTTAVSTTPASTTPPAVAVPTSAPGAQAEWCARAAEVRDLGERFEDLDPMDPEVVRAGVTELRDAVARANEVVPAEIADAVAVQLEFAQALDEVLMVTDYDMLTADLSIIEEYEAEVDSAEEAIDAYNVEHCGFDEEDPEADDEDDDDGFDFGEGSMRDQFVAQLVAGGFTQQEAECIFGEIDFSDPDSFDDEEAMSEVFVACEVDLARIEEMLGAGAG